MMPQTEYDSLAKLSQELIDAKPEAIAAERPENFCDYCRKALDRLRDAGMRSGRGKFMVQLGLKIAEVSTNPEKYQLSAGNKKGDVTSISSTAKEREEPRSPAEKISREAASVGVDKPTHASDTEDEDDQPW
jgi:hypothetical protein